MKTIASIITASVLSALSGCSDNFNPVSSLEVAEKKQSNNPAQIQINGTLLWEHSGMAVIASGERIVWEEVFCDLQRDGNNNILITFDGWTNADTTSYVSQVTIEAEGRTLLTEGGEQYINRHHGLNVENIETGTIRFYIALWCDEIECSSSAALKISDIKIYSNYIN